MGNAGRVGINHACGVQREFQRLDCAGSVADSIAVTFTPTAEVAYSGQLVTASNAAAGETVLALTGQGLPTPIAFADWAASKNVPANQQGAQDDPNSDGISNYVAYALNIDPMTGALPSDTNARMSAQITEEGVVSSS